MIDLIRKRCVAIDSVIKDLNMEYHAIKSKVLREEYKKWKKELYSERCRVLVLQPAVQCNGRDGGLASFYTSDLAGGMDSVKVV